MKQVRKRIGSLFLAFCIVFTMLPGVAFAETSDVDSGTPLGVSGEITAFAALSAEVASQTVGTGTAEDELNLPDTLAVMITTGSVVTVATDSDASKETQITVDASAWTAEPEYDGNTAGNYTFTPALELPDGVSVSEGVSAPTITVTVEEADAPIYSRSAITPLAGAAVGTINISQQPTPTLTVAYRESPGTISVEATTTNGASITYQWLVKNDSGTSSNTGDGNNTLDIGSDYLPGSYEIYCELTAEGCDTVESERTALTVNKANYIGSDSDTIYVKSGTSTSNSVYTLPGLPVSDMTYEILSNGSNLLTDVTAPKRDETTNWKWLLTFSTDGKPANTEDTITLKINGGHIYDDSIFTLTVKALEKFPVTITGLIGTNNEYSGNPQTGYTGTPNTGGYIGELNTHYQGRNDTSYESATSPTDAGEYTVTLSIPNEADYSGSADVDFAIRKREVVVKPIIYTIMQGQDLPIVDNSVNYSGFVSGDNASNSISQWAVAQLNVTDSNTPGESDITFATQAELEPEKAKNYTLKHENGTLTIQAATATLTLDINYGGQVIDINCGTNDTIKLVYSGDVSITSADASTIYCKGNLVINGSGGTLTLNYTGSSGMSSALDVQNELTIQSSTVNATSSGSGSDMFTSAIYGATDIIITGDANVTATATGANSNGIYTGQTAIISTTGTVAATGAGVEHYGLRANNNINLSSGTVTLSNSDTPANLYFGTLNHTGGTLNGNSPTSGTDITANFTDPNFLMAVREALGKVADNRIYDTDNFASVTTLNVSDKNIENLSGIEYFKALTSLNCNDNQLSSLNVSANTALQKLICRGNNLSQLDITGLNALTEFNCCQNYMADESKVLGFEGTWDGTKFVFNPQNSGTSTYAITVNNGTADPSTAAQGTTVIITAGTAPGGKQFKAWQVVSGGINP
ncbi:hypothetical protein [Anaerovorax sp. IOR16]|uniref:hypothetical protein n=1 Tax=Anaerovorax sp. IOR16 TaxID=2773458 RepID=UPI0019D18061|nr:hypothetical protein [Anaerovorax sp. IOR16]